MKKVKSAGFPVLIHCNGDAWLEMALDAIEAAYGSAPPSTGINRIEHCTQVRPDQIARMKKMNVQASHLMNNVYYYGAAYRDEFRARTCCALQPRRRFPLKRRTVFDS